MKKDVEDIRRMIARLPRMETPRGFTEDIMQRIGKHAVAGIPSAPWYRLMSGHLVTPQSLFAIGSHRECSLCFFMTGIFYFITGIILFLGFREGALDALTGNWMARQPEILLISAGVLILLGLVMFMKGKLPVAIAQKGVFLFIGFAVFNAVMTREVLWWQTLPTSLVFIITFISIIMGIMFAVALDKYQRCMDLG